MRPEGLFSTPPKKKHQYLLIVFPAFLLLSLFQPAHAQSGRRPVRRESTPPLPASVEAKPEPARPKKTSEGDQIYNSRQVDATARITKGGKDSPRPRGSCPSGQAIVRAVLHKSGRVIDVSLVKGLGCSFDKDAIEIVRKYKFTPAMKDGQPVSQAILIEFEHHRFL